jgi:glycosyltransferase involved in cell wall biosynthesis
MASSPLFSVIIPTYNRANFIGDTIKSIQDQQFQDFEVIIVDDGSSDNTEEVVAEIHEPRLRYIKIKNSERAVARNTGGLNAAGQYVTFLDSDDQLKPDHLLTASQFIAEQPAEVFSQGYEVVHPDKSVIHKWSRLPNPVNEKLLQGNYLSCLGVFIRRDIFLNNKFNEDRDLSGSEDYELWMRLAAKYPIYTVPKSTAYLIQHDSRSVINISADRLVRRITLLEYYATSNAEVNRKFGNKLASFKGYNDLYTSLHLAMARENKLASRYAIRAVKHQKSILLDYRFWVVMKKIIFK